MGSLAVDNHATMQLSDIVLLELPCSGGDLPGPHPGTESLVRSLTYTRHLTEFMEGELSILQRARFPDEGPSPPQAPHTPAEDAVPSREPGVAPALTSHVRGAQGAHRPFLPLGLPSDRGWVAIRLESLCEQPDADRSRILEWNFPL